MGKSTNLTTPPSSEEFPEFLVPHGKSSRISVSIGIGFILLVLAGIIFGFTRLGKPPPGREFALVIGALLMLSLLAAMYSLARDVFQYQPRTGLGFTRDWLYLHRLLGKMKIPWSEVRKVSFSPAVLTHKDPSKRFAYLKVQSSRKSYLLFVTNYEVIAKEFEKRRVPTTVIRWKLPAYALGFGISMQQPFRPIGGLIFIYFLLTSFFSRNRIFSRRTELLTLIFTVGVSLFIYVLTALTK